MSPLITRLSLLPIVTEERSGHLSGVLSEGEAKNQQTADINCRIDVITKLAFLLINIIARYLLLIGLSQKLHLRAALIDRTYYGVSLPVERWRTGELDRPILLPDFTAKLTPIHKKL